MQKQLVQETSNNAIKSENDTDNITIINNSGGHIHNNNSANTVYKISNSLYFFSFNWNINQ